MAPTLSVLLAARIGSGIENDSQPSRGNPASKSEAEPAFDSMREAREAVARVMRESTRPGGRESAETASSIASIDRRLTRSEKLPAAERRTLQARLRARVPEEQVPLCRREQQRGRASYSGGTAADAAELINLIQTTIAPDTWEINGGRGSIYYFPNR